ncbi:pre-mRNA cleavage complex 2 protein Pcf11 isoform X2 [Drosophila takahashii]|uniref:pre-mRNA cleavage complex 2 protein Pcf11 isoform X2 n=1 Tax=Drosophila takahashii TaxID=29030 RepID=UPI0038995639
MDQLFQSCRDDERRIGEEYLSSLQDLNCNSKPLINMLTMLAEENINYAHIIVKVVEYYISQVPPEFKLPILYLIDSIVKNVKSSYVQLFGQCIVNIFLHAFESVQHSQSQLLEKVRERMYALRQTWNEVFPPSKMYALDVKVKQLDNNWPITAKQPAKKIHVNPAIHVNPDFLKPGMVPVMPVNPTLPSDMEEILQAKTRELLELKKRKLELELEQTKKHLEEQERQLNQATDAMAVGSGAMPAPHAAAIRPPIMDPGLAMRNQRAPGNAGPIMPQQQFANKPKVNPVNPALLNSVRQRDPRLARQMQPQSSHPAAPARNDPRLEAKSSSSSTQKSSRSRSKSPVRNSSSRSGKSGSGSSHHSSSSSRKRSESKSSTASSSSSGSEVRHKSGSNSSSSSNQSPVKRSGKHSSKEPSDRYVRNGSPTGSSKRKSSSPSSSPSKSKRSASHKSSSSSSRGKPSSSGRSRSRSPVFMDVDLRGKSPETKAAVAQVAASSAAAAPKASNDLEKPNLSTASLLNPNSTTSAAASSVRQPSPSPSSSSVSSQGNVSDALQLSINKLLQVQGGASGAAEKRPADDLPPEMGDEEQPPQQKRSKSTKLDALFGSEDVDLRREIPAVKPGVIVVEDDSMDNCDVSKPTKKSGSPPKRATFSDVRAKLANSARQENKMGKSDKAKDQAVSQRIKQLAELKANDDSQEAHDEKVRTILSQAQEMYENHGMNQEQYKDLVQNLVNETSKKKDARRRDDDLERNAARDAVLRKRIPKLKGNENHSSGSPRSDGSPRYEDQPVVPAPEKPSVKRDKTKRDIKRRKPSKWGDQVDPGVAQRNAWQLANANNNNNNNNINNIKRVGIQMPVQQPQQPGFRGMPWQQPPAMVMAQSAVPPPPQPPSMMGLPPVPPVTMTKAINSLDNPMADVVRSITIDGGSKEIRFYNQVAIIFMDGDQPHEIGFQPGQRVILIDHNEPLPLCFNDDYKPFQLDGQLHRIRFGFPSRELYIDDHWYEIYFGGPPVSLPIGNKMHVIKAEGPPPNVDIGRVRRDLVVGKINMIVDAHNIVPLFLDARQQTFQLGAEQHSLQFVDSFQYALLDGQLQKIEYGGLPKGMTLNGGRSCFIRFGTLPKGVIAGRTHVADMVYIKTEAPAEPPKPPPMIVRQPPVVEQPKQAPAAAAVAPISLPAAAAALESLNINDLFQKLVSSGIIGGAAAVPAADSSASKKEETIPASEPSTAKATAAAAPVPAPVPAEPIKRIDLHKPETIKTRQSAVVATLYLGMQCSSCGVRFPPEQTIKYSQHLDWHFRQNRRERDSTRKATSRRWYYDLNDWRQYEEIEDVEEREKNFLEAQGQPGGIEALEELSQQRSLDSPVPTCAAGTDDVDHCCDMCHEKFEQFYNEELEEWHLRSAIRVEDKIYHPLCYEDYKASLNPPAEVKSDKDVDMNNTDDNAMDTLIKVEDDDDEEGAVKPSQSIIDDDDDDVIVLPNEEPSVTEIVDDDDEDEYVPGNVTRADMGNESQDKPESSSETKEQEKEKEQPQSESANESDVEIQEPNIPFTDLDTYVEKEMDEATRAALLNVKIKEEPKDEYEDDEDDGFEDVGTVVSLLPLPEDEISIHSSETQTHTIGSSASPATIERPASVTSLSLPANEAEDEVAEQADASVAAVVDSEAELNGERQESTHNLSAVGPALPLASIVNKIKINITKNTSSNSHNSASNATTTTDSQVSAISVIGGSGGGGGDAAAGGDSAQQQVNAIQTISTIPVLCGGNTFVPKIATSTPSSSVISSISVIGSSYGGSSNSSSTSASASLPAETTASRKSPTPPPPAVAAEPDPEPVVEMKPALRNATLKRTKKVQNGIETSGLCSIM